jgi:hypothetical protein
MKQRRTWPLGHLARHCIALQELGLSPVCDISCGTVQWAFTHSSIGFTLLATISPLSPSEVCDSPCQASHYHFLIGFNFGPALYELQGEGINLERK